MKKIALCISIALSIYSKPCFATETDTLKVIDIEEVTVVARQKESGKLRQQPTASTLLSAHSLQTAHVTGIKQLSGVVPNLFIPDYGSRLTTAVYIRGIGSRINTPSVGLYVDNMPYFEQAAFDFHHAEIERIDVLRGPQGTLYGRNAMAGIIKIHTKSPFQYQGTYLTLGAATHNDYKASLSHYHRVSSRFAFSAGGFYDYTGGFFRNAALDNQKVDHGQTAGGHFRGIYLPGSHWKLSLNLNYEYNDQGGYPYQQVTASPTPPTIAYNRESSYRRNLLNSGLLAEYQANRFSISSATSYQWIDDRMFLDQDFTPQDIYTLEQRQRLHTFSEEIVMKSNAGQRHQWTTGLFGYYQSTNTEAPVTFRADGMSMLNSMLTTHIPPRIEVSMGPDMAMNILPSLNITDPEMPIDGTFDAPRLGAALYHQSTFNHLFGLPGLSFTVGLRLDYEKMKLTYNSGTSLKYNVGIKGEMTKAGQVIREIEMMPATPLNVESRYQGKLSNHYIRLLPKIALQYQLGGGLGNVYASVSKGHRSGGYNIQSFSDLLQSSLRGDMMRQSKETIMSAVPAQYASLVGQYFPDAEANPDASQHVSYKPEQTWSYEAGSHLNLFKNRLQLDVAAFLMKTTDQQIARMAASGLGRETINAGRSRSIGAEMSITAAITNRLNMNAAYGYTHATFLPTNTYAGHYVPFVPRHTLHVGGSYTHTLPQQVVLDRIVLSANYHGVGRIFWSEDNKASQPFYGTLNGRIALHKGACQVAFWVQNLLNKHYASFYFDSMNRSFLQQGRPLQGGIEIQVKF